MTACKRLKEKIKVRNIDTSDSDRHAENGKDEKLTIFRDTDAFATGKEFRLAVDAYFDVNITPLDH